MGTSYFCGLGGRLRGLGKILESLSQIIWLLVCEVLYKVVVILVDSKEDGPRRSLPVFY